MPCTYRGKRAGRTTRFASLSRVPRPSSAWAGFALTHKSPERKTNSVCKSRRLILGEDDGTLLTTAILRRIVDRRSLSLALHRAEHQRPAFYFFRQAFELGFAIDVGRRLEIKPPYSHKPISNVDTDARIINRRAFDISNRKGNRTRPSLAVHHRNLVRVGSLLGIGGRDSKNAYKNCDTE